MGHRDCDMEERTQKRFSWGHTDFWEFRLLLDLCEGDQICAGFGFWISSISLDFHVNSVLERTNEKCVWIVF